MSHPVLDCVDSIKAALQDVESVSVTFMETGVKRDALLALNEATSRLEELRLRLLAGSDDVAHDEGFRDIGQWLAHHVREDRPSTRRSLRLARALDRRWTGVAKALAEGRLNLAQAAVIVRGPHLPAPGAADPRPSRAGRHRARDRRGPRATPAGDRGTPSPQTHQPGVLLPW